MSKLQPKKSSSPVTPMPIEPILTRNKTSQNDRQLRKKDRSMTAITQLLKSSKSGTIKTQSKKLTNKKYTNSKKVSQDNVKAKEETKYSKNSVHNKKITLKPKYDGKVIARTNKRKLNTPQRSIISTTQTDVDKADTFVKESSLNMGLTMADMIRMTDEKDCLNDDDLMEILTCPSPVWWEDPPDDNYFEDAISLKMQTNDTKEIDFVLKKTKVDFNDNEKMVNKKKSLEKILSNIKNKSDGNVNNKVTELNKLTINSDGNEYDAFSNDLNITGDELLRDLENTDIPIEGVVKKNDLKDDSNGIVKIKLIDKVQRKTKREMKKIRMKRDNLENNSKDTKNINEKETQFFLDKNNQNIVTVSKDTESLCDVETYLDKSNLITVYKIMSQKFTLVDDEDDKKLPKIDENNVKVKKSDGNLNAFFKKRKKTHRIDAKETQCDFCKKSFVNIPDSDRKICLHCSSIYEDTCSCSVNAKCTCILDKYEETVYNCKECDFKSKALEEIHSHLKLDHVRENISLSKRYNVIKRNSKYLLAFY